MHAVYGTPPAWADQAVSAVQYSPLIPGSATLEECPPHSLAQCTVIAPPGTLERRYILALALQALAPHAPLTAMAPKDKGGARLRKELESFGCSVAEDSRQHWRICSTTRPTKLQGLAEAIQAGGPQRLDTLGLYTQPGVFSWDRIDPGTALLLEQLPPLSGKGADLGCGIGVLSHAVVALPAVAHLTLIDNDRRAIEAARRNVDNERTDLHWADLREKAPCANLDFVVMNPPFHDGGEEDRQLGKLFISRAREMLKPGGLCVLVANRHLPYEALLQESFRQVTMKAQNNRYKIHEAIA